MNGCRWISSLPTTRREAKLMVSLVTEGTGAKEGDKSYRLCHLRGRNMGYSQHPQRIFVILSTYSLKDFL